jgi:hypothetical protein
MDLNPDYSDLLRSFNDAGVRYLLVGGYAYAYHAEPRYTKDLDVWVEPSSENAERVWRALLSFGAAVRGLKKSDFSDPRTIFQIGMPINRIDVITGISAADFGPAWRNRVDTKFGTVPVHVIGLRDFIRNKRASGRPRDLLDIERLRRFEVVRRGLQRRAGRKQARGRRRKGRGRS